MHDWGHHAPEVELLPQWQGGEDQGIRTVGWEDDANKDDDRPGQGGGTIIVRRTNNLQS